jgi:anti-sigma-K factor RskA
MSREPDTAEPTGDDILAGEYALGLLTGDERRLVESRLRTDRAFAALEEQWRMRLAGFAAEARPVDPDPSTWTAIERRVFPESERRRLWDSLAFWRGLAAAAAGVAAGSLAFALFVARPEPARQPLVASLQATDAGPSYVARIDPESGQLFIRAVNAGGDGTRVPELWVIPGDGVARSLGVIERDGASQVTIPAALRQFLSPEAALAISLEPPGGSPTGQATGPIIAVGRIGEL